MSGIIFPKPLREGSKIAIISPASIVREEYIRGASEFLLKQGFEPVVMPHAGGPADGSYASSLTDRLSDFISAWTDREIDAVLCARGGYGAAHLLPALDAPMLRDNAKWLIGFSDISALHAALLTAGVSSIHGPMAKHLTEDPDHPSTRALMGILRGERMEYAMDGNELDHPGEVTGALMGGNLAVLNGLAAGPYDILERVATEEAILFIEDISEAIYAVERMLWRLYLAGTLQRVKGLVIGRFTEYRPDRNFNSMYEMISSLLTRIDFPAGIPVTFGFPTGHVTNNLPLIQGAEVSFKVSEGRVSLRQI